MMLSTSGRAANHAERASGLPAAAQKVDVLDGFITAPEGACKACGEHSGGASERGQQLLRDDEGLAVEVALLVALQVADAREDLLLGPGPETGQLYEAILRAGVFQLAEGLDGKLFVEGADLLRSQAGDAQHLEMPGRDGGPELVVILKMSRRDEFGDLFAEGIADALDGRQAAPPHQLFEVLLEGLQPPCGIGVSDDLEGRLPLELEVNADLFEVRMMSFFEIKLGHGSSILSLRAKRSNLEFRICRVAAAPPQ